MGPEMCIRDRQVLANQVASIPNNVLIWTVAVGVGVFLALAVLRIFYRASLAKCLLIAYALLFALTLFSPKDFLAVAFDAGGVTTGPITVPFIMALGVGVSALRAAQGHDDDSFGLVALCSVGPILMVLLLGIFYHPTDAAYSAVEIAPVITTRDVAQQFALGFPGYAEEVLLSILPIVALIVIFAGFDGMTVHGNWTGFFLVLGGLTSAAGVLGLCIFRDSPALRPVQGDTYLRDVLYAFRPANIRANKMIYICFLGMMFSGLAMQLWQPYMISLVEVTLGIDNYILPIGIVVLASAVLSVLAGKAMDRFGKEKFYYPVAVMQVLGGLIAYSIKFLGHAMPLLCVGGTCIMAGNLAMAGLFTASSRDYTPAGRAGASQSVKMVIYIMLPMVLSLIHI